MKNVLPRKEVPRLRVETTSGMQWDLRDQKTENFTIVIFYRGLHCPVCKSYLEELNKKAEKFQDRGVDVICISANNKSLAEKTVKEWDVDNLTIGYDFNPEDARKWDLYISEGMKDEPEVFFEPGLFLIQPDNTLYAASIQTMPFARPKFNELLKAIDFILDKDYPARGEA
ncbi:alkyl hydroperoxide reductase [Salegentibacter salinarum]|uniref:Alkyl hydroperoxide reductase n=1 Tax=Salegentibacter salinarum TaxID=447422 RepID=A0A2N0TN65_9FLAO|nr:redoxin domain-containing protein [Salegentibacter salinarum]PKD16138.1 alkyl hydroperoxide reductase [Salegentibacter salinarum]SKB68944.1 Alkyl hydroperoxide reductase subunit AhpC (peroxiredoxin) [Salegentibacter salinarum]